MSADRFDWRRAMAIRLASPPSRSGREVARSLPAGAASPAAGRSPWPLLALAGLVAATLLLAPRLQPPRPVPDRGRAPSRTVALELASGTRLYVVIDERSRP